MDTDANVRAAAIMMKTIAANRIPVRAGDLFSVTID